MFSFLRITAVKLCFREVKILTGDEMGSCDNPDASEAHIDKHMLLLLYIFFNFTFSFVDLQILPGGGGE